MSENLKKYCIILQVLLRNKYDSNTDWSNGRDYEKKRDTESEREKEIDRDRDRQKSVNIYICIYNFFIKIIFTNHSDCKEMTLHYESKVIKEKIKVRKLL